jgi:hypothetical protein
MSESPWNEEGAPAPKKKSVPTWAWWVGGGCLLMLLAAVAAVLLIGSFVKKSLDPEKQWPKVAKVLPFDSRPENLTLVWGSQIGMELYVFHDANGLIVTLMCPPGDGGKSKQKMFDEKQSFSAFGKGGRHSMQPATIRVQGRELQALRFVQEAADSSGPSGAPSAGSGGSVLVDVTPEDSEQPVIIQLTRANGSQDAISDQTVIDLLAPFHVGPER